jgi:hypothetical protein
MAWDIKRIEPDGGWDCTYSFFDMASGVYFGPIGRRDCIFGFHAWVTATGRHKDIVDRKFRKDNPEDPDPRSWCETGMFQLYADYTDTKDYADKTERDTERTPKAKLGIE